MVRTDDQGRAEAVVLHATPMTSCVCVYTHTMRRRRSVSGRVSTHVCCKAHVCQCASHGAGARISVTWFSGPQLPKPGSAGGVRVHNGAPPPAPPPTASETGLSGWRAGSQRRATSRTASHSWRNSVKWVACAFSGHQASTRVRCKCRHMMHCGWRMWPPKRLPVGPVSRAGLESMQQHETTCALTAALME